MCVQTAGPGWSAHPCDYAFLSGYHQHLSMYAPPVRSQLATGQPSLQNVEALTPPVPKCTTILMHTENAGQPTLMEKTYVADLIPSLETLSAVSPTKRAGESIRRRRPRVEPAIKYCC